MKKHFINLRARCIDVSDNACVLVDDESGTRCLVDNEDIEKFVELPPSLMDGNHFRVGAEVALCGIFYENGGVKWVPDQKVYPKKVFSTLNSLGEENCRIEFKRSLIHTANNETDMDAQISNNRPAQYKVIAKEIAGMVTARSRNAEVIIGCDDNGYPVGINNEVRNRVETESDLRNYLFQSFCNIAFVSNLKFTWEEPENRLILRIQIPEYNGDILLVGQTEIYYRNGSNTTRVKGAEMLNLIRTYNENSNNKYYGKDYL